jgi:D-glycero-D-manno-heptose 1,7-bisphosphate phosphatase
LREPSSHAVFLDRDGVLNVYLPGDYVKTPAELALIPGVAEAVRALNEAGYPVFVISNQQGVAKGLMSTEELTVVSEALTNRLAAAGATITQSYYCPHASGSCDCRKPKPGMLLCAADEHGIDLAASVFIGDTETDSEAARAAGVGRFLLVLSGKFQDPAVAADPKRFPIPPDGVYPTLVEAVRALLGK